MNSYEELKTRHQNEVNAFPVMFAFSEEQFNEGMRQLGLEPSDTDKVCTLTNTGGFMRKTDSDRFHEMMSRHKREWQEALDGDTTGLGYILDMFRYELRNHEYGYTWELDPTLDALGLTREIIDMNKPLRNGLFAAIEEIKKEEEGCEKTNEKP